MIIVEYQYCNTKRWEAHECSTGERCNTPVREHNLPDEQRDSWIEFFQWVLDNEVEPRIYKFEVQPASPETTGN